MMDPQIERFLKVDQAMLKTKYREIVNFNMTDLSNEEVTENVIGGMIPYKIDVELNQTIRQISITKCQLTDKSV